MADDIDRANDYAERQRRAALAAIPRYHGESAPACRECGDPIPLPRRQAIPGCTLCVSCQGLKDATTSGGFWP